MAPRTCEHCGRDLWSALLTNCPYCQGELEIIEESEPVSLDDPATGNEVGAPGLDSSIRATMAASSHRPMYQGYQGDYHVTGWRVVAAIIDFIPLAILFFVMAFTLGEVQRVGASANATLDGWQTLHFLALAMVYYVVLEGVTETTLGKMLMGLRVIKTDEEHYGWMSVLSRNLLRIFDALPLFYLVGIISIGMTNLNQRLGDLAARTQVVRIVPKLRDESADPNPPLNPDMMIATDSSWKVGLAPKMAGAILAVALISGLSIYFSAQQAASPPSNVLTPTEEELRMLTTETLLELDRAIQTEDMTVFHASFSEVFRREFSPDELEKVFQPFITNNISISGIEGVVPVFDGPPKVSAQGVLASSGFYPTTPLRVLFDLEYIHEDSKWRLVAIQVNLME